MDKIPHMQEVYNYTSRFYGSPLMGNNVSRSIFGGGGFIPVRFNHGDTFRKNLFSEHQTLYFLKDPTKTCLK